MKNLVLLIGSVFIFSTETPFHWTVESYQALADKAYTDRINTFFASLECETTISEGNQYGITCKDNKGDLIYRKDTLTQFDND